MRPEEEAGGLQPGPETGLASGETEVSQDGERVGANPVAVRSVLIPVYNDRVMLVLILVSVLTRSIVILVSVRAEGHSSLYGFCLLASKLLLLSGCHPPTCFQTHGVLFYELFPWSQ